VYLDWESEVVYHSNLLSCDRRAKRALRGRVQFLNICCGHVPIAVRQDWLRRDAAAAGEEQQGRSTTGRLCPSRRCAFGDFELLAGSFAAGASPPAH
jgi:hypothetical protein